VAPVGLDDTTALLRSLSLMMETEILPVACRIAPEFYKHLVSESLLGNRDILRELVRGEISNTATRPEELAARMAPVPGPLYPLAIARFDRSRVSDQIYVVAPNVLTRHLFPAPAGGDRIVLRNATDIVANEIGVDLRVKDAFVVRFEQGVFDTNAETLLQLGHKAAGSTANAFAASSDWVTLTSADDSQLATLRVSDDDRKRVAQDLGAGSIVVMPKAPVRLGADEFVGWWRIDPARGDVLGVDTRGWGAAAGEYMFLWTLVSGAEIAYLMCILPPPSSSGTSARVSVPGLDAIVAPLAASGATRCLGEAVNGAALAGIFQMIGAASASGSGGGSGAGGSGSGGTGKGGGTGSGGSGGGPGAGGRTGSRSAGGTGGGGNSGGNGGPSGSGGASPQYRGPGGANSHEEVNPSGGTEPGARVATAPKTQPGPPPEMEPPPLSATPPPRTAPATPEEVTNLEQEVAAAQQERNQATGDAVRYKALKPNAGRNNPGDPSYNADEDAILTAKAMEKAEKSNDAIFRLKEAQEALASQRAAQSPAPVGRGGGLQPAPKPPANPFGCPPNCGNENKTGAAQDVQMSGQNKSVVGAVGVGNVLIGK
jgi:hypothetical protein